MTAGTQLQVIDARQVYADIQPIVPPSPFNVLGQAGSLDPISYRLNFALPQDDFGLTRPYIRSGVTGVALPEWQVSAYDAAGSLLGSVGENAFSIFSDLPARTFTLNGPDIRSVVVASNSHRFAAFGSAVLDDFMISAAPPGVAVPEPGSAGLLASAAVFGAVWPLRRSCRRR